MESSHQEMTTVPRNWRSCVYLALWRARPFSTLAPGTVFFPSPPSGEAPAVFSLLIRLSGRETYQESQKKDFLRRGRFWVHGWKTWRLTLWIFHPNALACGMWY